jgi:hypothetical protein
MSLRSAAVEHGGLEGHLQGGKPPRRRSNFHTPVQRAEIPEFGLLLEDVFDLSDLLLDFAGEVFGFAFCL